MAARIYSNKEGKRVRSVTTILRAWGDSGGLLHWANSQGLEGRTLDEAREESATPGVLAHAMIEAFVKGKDPFNEVAGPKAFVEKAAQSFEAFESWLKHSRVEILKSEVSLISEQHQFGGTMDALLSVDGELALGDWKTGRIYPRMIAQLGGYRILLDERMPEFAPKNIHLIRFAGEYGNFEHHCMPYTVSEIGKRAFLLAIEMADLDKAMKKVIG